MLAQHLCTAPIVTQFWTQENTEIVSLDPCSLSSEIETTCKASHNAMPKKHEQVF